LLSNKPNIWEFTFPRPLKKVSIEFLEHSSILITPNWIPAFRWGLDLSWSNTAGLWKFTEPLEFPNGHLRLVWVSKHHLQERFPFSNFLNQGKSAYQEYWIFLTSFLSLLDQQHFQLPFYLLLGFYLYPSFWASFKFWMIPGLGWTKIIFCWFVRLPWSESWMREEVWGVPWGGNSSGFGTILEWWISLVSLTFLVPLDWWFSSGILG